MMQFIFKKEDTLEKGETFPPFLPDFQRLSSFDVYNTGLFDNGFNE